MGCPIVLRTIELLQEENLFENVMERREQLRSRITNSDHPLLEGIRSRGLINATEREGEIAEEVLRGGLNRVLILRAINETLLGTSSPLIVSGAQINHLVDGVREVVGNVYRGLLKGLSEV